MGSKYLNQMYPLGFPRVTICQFVTVEEASWVFSEPWKFKVSIMLPIIIYFAVRSVGRLKVCSLLHFQSCCEWQSFTLGKEEGLKDRSQPNRKRVAITADPDLGLDAVSKEK